MNYQKSLRSHLDSPKPSRSRQKKRLVVYDFDNTIFESLNRENGESKYFEECGELWPHQGWWGRLETLMPPLVPDPVPVELFLPNTLSAYRKDRQQKDTHLVMMTGRPYKVRHRIREILHSQQMEFDEEHYRGCPTHPRGKDTIDIKLSVLKDWLFHDKLEVLEIWEDRPEHSSIFISEGKRLKASKRNNLSRFILHDPLQDTHQVF